MTLLDSRVKPLGLQGIYVADYFTPAETTRYLMYLIQKVQRFATPFANGCITYAMHKEIPAFALDTYLERRMLELRKEVKF